MKTVFVVIEHFGRYAEDSCSVPFSVCATRELAEQEKAKSENSHKTLVEREDWDKYCDEVNDWESAHENEEGFESWAEGIHYLHPELDYDELSKAEYVHCEDDYVYTEISEVIFIE